MKPLIVQRGSLAITAVILIVLVGAVMVLSANVYVGTQRSAGDGGASVQALALADAAIERGVGRWVQSPSYTGEGPVSLGRGSFTVTTANTDFSGAALPANQKRFIGTGTLGTGEAAITRTLSAIFATGGGASLVDSFANLSNWPALGPSGNSFALGCSGTGSTTTQSLDGTTGLDFTNNAPGSTAGSAALKIEVTSKKDRRTGYYQHTLATPATAGTTLTLGLKYAKTIGTTAPLDMLMALDVVASDNTVYRVWSHCGLTTLPWTTVNNFSWTVPATKTINRLRLGFDIRNSASRNALQRMWFDDVRITIPGGGGSFLSWREVVP